MDRFYKVFHIRYKTYPDLEWLLRDKVLQYERENQLLAESFSVMYDKEDGKNLEVRNAAIVVEFTDNAEQLSRYIHFQTIRIQYRLFGEFEDLLQLKIINYEKGNSVSRFEYMCFSVLHDIEADDYEYARNAIVLVMFRERSRIFADEREKIAEMTGEKETAYREALENPDKSYDPEKAADIYSTGVWEEARLSNFSETDFEFDGVHIKSMEGFLQSLKTSDVEKQIFICSLGGKDAKIVGSFVSDFDGTHLFWKGEPVDRFSEDYHTLLRRAYYARFAQDAEFRRALAYTKNKKLIHTVGKSDPKETILTDAEFITLLSELHELV